jgi:hypothetical protein
VEDIVYLPMRGEFDAIDVWTDDLCNSERSETFGAQFSGRM